MDLEGTRLINADRATVWAALNNADVLRVCIPGCKELEGTPEEGFTAVVKQKIGPVSATFTGSVVLENIVPNQSYTITGSGKGGVAGFAKGGADVLLADVEGGTELTYKATVSLGGKIAQLGSRIVGGVARKLADQFFDDFQDQVENGAA